MPVLNNLEHQPPWYLPGGQLQTLYPHFFRNVNISYERERWELPDGDFLDLDWVRSNSQKLLVVCHGLEGSSGSKYVVGMANYFFLKNWNILSFNFRSCSGEINRRLTMYHHGQTEDLQHVVEKLAAESSFQQICLVGFSLGGNVVLKYLGNTKTIPNQVKVGIGISVPSDLSSSSLILDQWFNRHYTWRFRKNLKKKFEIKNEMFPGVLPMEEWGKHKSWWDFDNTFTCKIFGFKDADEYYRQGSCNRFLPGIKVPALLIQAQNDPFLQTPSFPIEICNKLKHVYLAMPSQGGHVGFLGKNNQYWSEAMTHRFIQEKCLS